MGELGQEDATAAWEEIAKLSRSVTLHGITSGRKVIEIAQRLKRKNAYDAAHVALAEELHTDVWTIDGPLARNAAETGLPRQADRTPGGHQLTLRQRPPPPEDTAVPRALQAAQGPQLPR